VPLAAALASHGRGHRFGTYPSDTRPSCPSVGAKLRFPGSGRTLGAKLCRQAAGDGGGGAVQRQVQRTGARPAGPPGSDHIRRWPSGEEEEPAVGAPAQTGLAAERGGHVRPRHRPSLRPARRRPWPGPAGLDAAAAGRRPDGDHWARRRRTDHSTQRRRLAVPAGTSSGFRSDGRPGRAGRRGRARVRGPVVHVGHQAGGRVDKGQVGAEPLPLPPRRKIAHGQPLPKVSDEHAAVHHRNRLGVAGQRDTGERPAGRQLNLLEGEGPPRRARPPAEQPNPVGLRGGQYVQRTAKRRCRPWPSGTKDAGSPGRVARTASHAAQPSHHSAAREGQLTPTTSTVCAPSHPPWPCTPQMASDPYLSRRP